MTPVYEKWLYHGKEEHKFCVGGEAGGRERRKQPVMENPLWNKRKKKLSSN